MTYSLESEPLAQIQQSEQQPAEPRQEEIIVINETYPEWGKENGYVVCVGGINRELGQWRRLYPVPYYNWWNPVLKPRVGFSKWDIIRVTIQKQLQNKDPRKESYKLTNPNEIKIIGKIEDWDERRKILDPFVLPDLETLYETKQKENASGTWTSMGVIRPHKIIDFREQERHSVNDPGYRHTMKVQMKQLTLTGQAPPTDHYATPEPIAMKIGYIFECKDNGGLSRSNKKSRCHGHDMMCTDWEAGMLWRKMRAKYGDAIGFEKTRNKMLNWMLQKRDLYMMVGTVHKFPTFINVGLFYPPHVE